MQNTKNLVVATYARKLAVLTYRTTEHFPRSELYGLTSQMRRAAVAIGSNIAEGCGRSTDQAFRNCLDQAMGEASELEFQCLVAGDLAYGNLKQVVLLGDETERIKRMLSRLIVAVRNRGPRKAKRNPQPESSL